MRVSLLSNAFNVLVDGKYGKEKEDEYSLLLLMIVFSLRKEMIFFLNIICAL
jgi:hypothetical protein